ncbi:MAG: hypothetical protein R6U57_07025 [Anaerolineales bacterium]
MYIDPNFGGLLLQVLLIAFGVISGAVLIFSRKIKMWFARLRRSLREKTNPKDPPGNTAGSEEVKGD